MSDPHTAAIVDLIRTVARNYGWAIGVHGSMVRDIDLIAVPWTHHAAPWAEVHAALVAATTYLDEGRRVPMPLGRVAWMLLARGATTANAGHGATDPKGRWWPPAIDISVMDPRIYVPMAPA